MTVLPPCGNPSPEHAAALLHKLTTPGPQQQTTPAPCVPICPAHTHRPPRPSRVTGTGVDSRNAFSLTAAVLQPKDAAVRPFAAVCDREANRAGLQSQDAWWVLPTPTNSVAQHASLRLCERIIRNLEPANAQSLPPQTGPADDYRPAQHPAELLTMSHYRQDIRGSCNIDRTALAHAGCV